MEATLVFSPQDIKNLIEKQLPFQKIKSIEPIMQTETVGYGVGEKDVEVFKGYRVVY
jgi:hypothetical protein